MIDVLEVEEIKLRIRFAKAKVRNLAYYRSIDNEIRTRSQYIHILRSFREILKDLCTILKYHKDDFAIERAMIFNGIKAIPPKVKLEEVDQVISELVKVFQINDN